MEDSLMFQIRDKRNRHVPVTSATARQQKRSWHKCRSLRPRPMAADMLLHLEEYAIECSMIKVFCSEAMQNSSDDGVQIFGGMGFSADTPMEAAWRDARIGRIYEGTNEINRMVSVGRLLKKAAKGHLDLMTEVMKIVEKIKYDNDLNPSEELVVRFGPYRDETFTTQTIYYDNIELGYFY